MEVIDVIADVRHRLFTAFHEWIKHHRSVIGDSWYFRLLKEEKKAWNDCTDTMKMIGIALWMFNMVSQFGVLAGLGPSMVNIQHLAENLDESKTKLFLLWCSSSLGFQQLPREIMTQRIPEKEGPPWRFRLADYIKASIAGETDSEETGPPIKRGFSLAEYIKAKATA